jgi:hypothetical protein
MYNQSGQQMLFARDIFIDSVHSLKVGSFITAQFDFAN